MTLQELRELTDDTITPAQAADVLGCTGFLLGRMCQEEPKKVPFPFLCIGRKTIIPREGFIRWAEGRSREPAVMHKGDRLMIGTDGTVLAVVKGGEE